MSEPPRLVFVGGTGRSGTHIVARLLGAHSALHMVPIETRFHCNPRGLADVVTGEATVAEFVAKLRGFWWHRRRFGIGATMRLARLGGRGGKVRGLHKIIASDRFEEAIGRFEADVRAVGSRSADEDRVIRASRELFFDLLGPLAREAGKPGIVEMSCFSIAAAPGLERIFPEARFVHAVRDGRDSGSSKAAKRQKRHHPTGVADGIEWWRGRLRLAEEGVRGLADPQRVHVVSLDELVAGHREAAYAALLAALDLDDEPAMREFFEAEMSAGAANRGRWREGLDEREEAAVRRCYEQALELIEREGYHCAAALRQAYEHTEAAPA